VPIGTNLRNHASPVEFTNIATGRVREYLKLCSLQKREEQAQRMKKYKEAIVQKDIGDRIVF